MSAAASGAALPYGGAAPIRVQIVDDSAVMRGFLRRLLERDPGIVIAGAAGNGATALAQINADAPDVVLLDIDMPVMDGMAALPQLLKARPGVKIIMSSTLTRRNAAISLEALRLGASDYMPKPERAQDPAGAAAYGDELVAKIHALTRRRAPAPERVQPAAPAPRRHLAPGWTADIVAIGSSTGGPPALLKVFEGLAGVRQPIVITQHMPPTFTAMLAEHIARATGRPAAEARDGETLQQGAVYVAPAGAHLTVARKDGKAMARLSDGPPENFCKPAVDPMLRSLAAAFGSSVLAVILTGMGSDGAKGCEAVVRAGGRVIVQDEATSVIWGMPGAVARAGHADAVLPLPEVAGYIRRSVGLAS